MNLELCKSKERGKLKYLVGIQLYPQTASSQNKFWINSESSLDISFRFKLIEFQGKTQIDANFYYMNYFREGVPLSVSHSLISFQLTKFLAHSRYLVNVDKEKIEWMNGKFSPTCLLRMNTSHFKSRHWGALTILGKADSSNDIKLCGIVWKDYVYYCFCEYVYILHALAKMILWCFIKLNTSIKQLHKLYDEIWNKTNCRLYTSRKRGERELCFKD